MLKCGIVGLPNVGKSTLFNAITGAGAEAMNYPFCTIEPNVGVVPIPDTRLDAIAAIASSKTIIPATTQFLDIAGLVAGASKGEGLGNKFLANIRNTEAILHVVRCFENVDIAHVAGKIDPLSDIEVIHTELALADLETVSKSLLKTAKEARTGSKDALNRQALLEKIKVHLDAGKLVRTLELEEDDRKHLQELHLLTEKPTLYVANVAEDGFENNPYLDQVQAYADKEGSGVVAICASLESEIAELPSAERQEFLDSVGLKEPGLNRLIHASYKLLGLQTYFTAGPKEARAWTIHQGSSAPEAAGVIHTDFQKGFIRAEIVSYEDYLQYNGEHGAKEAGRWRSEGKEYVVQDGDIILFRFNV